MKKETIFLLSIGSAVIVALAVLVYFLLVGGTPLINQPSRGLLPNGSLNNPSSLSSPEQGAVVNDLSGTPSAGVVPEIRQITTAPVVGATTFLRGNSEIIRYMERSSGNVFETRADSLATTRLSNMTVPRVQEVLWFGSGRGLILRYLDGEKLKTYSALIATTTSSGEGKLSGVFLSDDITEIVVNPAGNKIFYMEKSGTGALGTLANPDGSSAAKIFSSPISGWNISWPNEGSLFFTNKPVENAASFSYLFNIKTRAFTRIFGDAFGLSSLASPDVKSFFSLAEGPASELSILLNASGAPKESPLSTFPEKCVWNKKSSLLYCGVPFSALPRGTLESWYRGELPLSDGLWSLDVKTGIGKLITTFSQTGKEMDITQPLLTPNETHFLFVNKNDLTLWSVRVSQATTTSAR